jgi:Protein of unknown function (DUF1173)
VQSFRIGSQTLSTEDEHLAQALADAHQHKLRPLCLCQPAGVAMYVASVWGRFVIKRMPNTGVNHHPDCDSYEPPAELSGLGEVTSAIQEDTASGLVALKVDFRLSKGVRRTLPVTSSIEHDSVKTDGKKLTLRGVLHYLWDQAGLNRWSPAMSGKRDWYVVRKYLLQAAENKTTKGGALGASLFIPETFSVARKQEILERRLAKLLPAQSTGTGPAKLMLLLAEVKQIDAARFGHKLIIKHLPDLPFLIATDLHERMARRFATELALWQADSTTHLIVVGTFGFEAAGLAAIEELSLIVTTENWLPVEHVDDLHLLAELTRAGRRFTKALRYNLPNTQPLATATLTDTQPQPVAMYLVPASINHDYKNGLQALIDSSTLPAWVWMAGQAAMPALPPVVEYRAKLSSKA